MKVALVTFLLTVSLLAAAACGGDGDRLTREELISQADAICVKYLDEAAALGLPERVEEVDEWAAGLKSILDRLLREQRALESPEDIADEYDQLISSNEEQADLLGDLARTVVEGDRARFEEIAQEVDQKEQEDRRLAKQIGLRDCEQYTLFDGDGYSFAYPAAWDQREGQAGVQAGARCSSVYFGPGQGADSLSISVCRGRALATEENIDELLDSLAAELEQSVRQAQGEITRGPTRVTVDELRALRVHATVITPDDVRVESRVVVLFEGATRFSLTCQFRSESAAKMKHGCDVVFGSFQVH